MVRWLPIRAIEGTFCQDWANADFCTSARNNGVGETGLSAYPEVAKGMQQ